MQILILLAALGQFPTLNQHPAVAWPSFRQPSTQTVAPQVNPPPLAEPGEGLLVMAFTSTWCGPCARIKPALQALEAEGIAVQYVDYDTDRPLVLAHNVTTLPTTIVLERGIEVSRRVGVIALDELRTLIPHRSPQPVQAPPATKRPEIPPTAVRRTCVPLALPVLRNGGRNWHDRSNRRAGSGRLRGTGERGCQLCATSSASAFVP